MSSFNKNGNIVGTEFEELAFLPTTYSYLEFLESSGTQYINFEFPLLSTDDIFLYMSLLSVEGDQKFFGAYGDNSSNVALGVYQNKWRLGSGWQSNTIEATTDKTLIKLSGGDTYSVNDSNVTISYGTVATNEEVSAQPVLFGIRYQGSITSKASIRVYGLFIQNNGRFTHYLMPALRNSDGVPGLYDSVTGVFHTNGGSGNFTYMVLADSAASVGIDMITTKGLVEY